MRYIDFVEHVGKKAYAAFAAFISTKCLIFIS